MGKFGSFLVLGFICAVSEAIQSDRLVEIFIPDQDTLQHLGHLMHDGYDFWSPLEVGANATMLLTPEKSSHFFHYVNQHNIPHSLLDFDLEEAVEEERRQIGVHRVRRQAQQRGPTRWREIVGRIVKYADMVSWLRHEVRNCSFCTLLDIGRSFQNRELLVVQIGNNYDRPGIFIDSGMHAREWIAPATNIYVVSKLIREYGRNPTITDLVNRYTWYFLIMANPDGYEYSFTSARGARYWRKNRSATSAAGCFGVDLNRNFDIDFGRTASSTHACSDTFHGDYAFSEPESAAVANFILQRNNELAVYITLHSFGQYVLVPYGYKLLTYPPDFREMMRVANITANAIRRVYGTKFRAGNTATLLYPSSGGSDDWAKAVANIKYAYTIELRPESGATVKGFLVNQRDIVPSGEEFLRGLIALAESISV